MVKNSIGKNPIEEKFRRIKTTNAKLKAALFSLGGIEGLLVTAGFQRVEKIIHIQNYTFGFVRLQQ